MNMGGIRTIFTSRGCETRRPGSGRRRVSHALQDGAQPDRENSPLATCPRPVDPGLIGGTPDKRRRLGRLDRCDPGRSLPESCWSPLGGRGRTIIGFRWQCWRFSGFVANSVGWWYSWGPGLSVGDVGRFARISFAGFAGDEVFLVLVIVPTTAGRVIAEERDRADALESAHDSPEQCRDHRR